MQSHRSGGELPTGGDGQWAWLLHRVGGIGILAFLFLHVFDIYLMNLGEDIFSKFLILYTAPVFKVMEVALIFGVLFHAINGIRIIIIDFWPATTVHERLMFRVAMVLTLIAFVPTAVITLSTFFHTPA
ncbi:MAG: succinate dehydrogenase, cytochrome b556 subunit [Anaerolineae bacterium]|nr:MAG: succinate dehydrogenase, cytochrome b556 subunit [Anaerolineae bacterium]